MMTSATLLQLASSFAFDAGFSWIVGNVFARCWFTGQKSPPLLGRLLYRSQLGAAAVCMFAMCGSLWAAAAIMTGEPLFAARESLFKMVIQTSYGRAAIVGTSLLIPITLLSAIPHRGRVLHSALLALLMAVGAARAFVSHGGEGGVFSLGFAVEWAHFVLTAFWVGGVCIAGWLVLPIGEATAGHAAPFFRYLGLLSEGATVALVGITLTGVYNALQRVGSVQNAFGNDYATVLSIKLAFVGAAVALGGYNRLFGFPQLTAGGRSFRKVMAILRLESLLLLCALAAAVVLTTMQPPTA